MGCAHAADAKSTQATVNAVRRFMPPFYDGRHTAVGSRAFDKLDHLFTCSHDDYMSNNLVGARELKARLGSYLRRVRQGQTLVVTDRGQPVAELRPLAGC